MLPGPLSRLPFKVPLSSGQINAFIPLAILALSVLTHAALDLTLISDIEHG